jgi:hypothetical protein
VRAIKGYKKLRPSYGGFGRQAGYLGEAPKSHLCVDTFGLDQKGLVSRCRVTASSVRKLVHMALAYSKCSRLCGDFVCFPIAAKLVQTAISTIWPLARSPPSCIIGQHTRTRKIKVCNIHTVCYKTFPMFGEFGFTSL